MISLQNIRMDPELVVPDTLSRDGVPKLLCQRCYQERDNLSLLQCLENIGRTIVPAVIEGQENKPAERIERPGPPSAQRLRDAQREELGDLAEYARTQKTVAASDEGIPLYSGRDESPVFVPSTTTNEVLR